MSEIGAGERDQSSDCERGNENSSSDGTVAAEATADRTTTAKPIVDEEKISVCIDMNQVSSDEIEACRDAVSRATWMLGRLGDIHAQCAE